MLDFFSRKIYAACLDALPSQYLKYFEQLTALAAASLLAIAVASIFLRLGVEALPAAAIIFMLPLAPMAYVQFKAYSLGANVERELPFLVMTLAIFSRTGSSFLKVLYEHEKLSKVLPISSRVLAYVDRDVNLLGSDFLTSLMENSSRTGSRFLKDLFEGLAVTVKSGGDVTGFLDFQLSKLLANIHEKIRAFTEDFLQIMINMYVVVVIVVPVLLFILKVASVVAPMVEVPLSPVELALYNVVVVPLFTAFMSFLVLAKNPSYM